MTDTSISDAVAFPQDDGTGVSGGQEDFDTAGFFGLIARQADGEYVHNGMGFNDIGSDQVDIGAGHCFIEADQNTISVQSGAQETYDTDLPSGTTMTYVVVFPTEVTNLGLGSNAVNDIYVFLDNTTNDGISVRHGSSVQNPENDATPKPAIKLGEVDTNDDTVNARSNDAQVMTGGAAQVVKAAQKLTAEDGTMSGKTLESGESMTVESDESFVVSDEYTANGDLTIKGSMTIM